MDPNIALKHLLAWTWPALGLTLVLLVFLRFRLRQKPPVRVWIAMALTFLTAGLLTQAVSVGCLGWPDGSMAGYGLLVLVMSLLPLWWLRRD